MTWKSWLHRPLGLLILTAVIVIVTGTMAIAAPIRSFMPLARYVVEGTVAEIIAATPDGQTLVFTNADDQQVGILSLSNPKQPRLLTTVDVSSIGEPTSVAVTPNGEYALVAVLDTTEAIADQKPGTLVFIDLRQRRQVASLTLAGIGPDSLAITPDGRQAVIAIEDEEDEENLPGSRPGSVNIVTIDYRDPAQSLVTNVPIDLRGVDGVNYVNDPQPEFVAISPDGKTAAVTLQENNAIAILDLAEQQVTRIFTAGTTRHRADTRRDGEIQLRDDFAGRREPDAIAFTRDGNYLVTANEGDTDRERFGDNVWSGGRGWTVFDLKGAVVYESGNAVESLAVLRGQYPEGRSNRRGVELEGAAVAEFGGQELAIIGSERGSFLTVYDISNPRSPQLLSFLPSGRSPEGIIAIPQRNLLLSANEGDGTIDIFQASSQKQSPYTATEPLVHSRQLSLPFSALSGFHMARANDQQIYAVPDNAIAPSRIYTLQLQGNEALVTRSLILTKNGQPVAYDPEGITLDPSGGFWIVSEGDDREGSEQPNLLLRVNGNGVVTTEIPLPDEAAQRITRFGFEGVTMSADGRSVYVAIQRAFKDEQATRIAAYDTVKQEWSFYFYPLDTDNVAGWVGLSEIARDVDGNLIVIERDNQGGSNGAANVRIKRLYRFSLAGLQPGDTVQKQLVSDLFREHNWYEEKLEGLAVTKEGYWVASDNDGGEMYSRLLFVSRPTGSQPIPGLW